MDERRKRRRNGKDKDKNLVYWGEKKGVEEYLDKVDGWVRERVQ